MYFNVQLGTNSNLLLFKKNVQLRTTQLEYLRNVISKAILTYPEKSRLFDRPKPLN